MSIAVFFLMARSRAGVYCCVLGWITLTITAQVYKLFPMFVWEERFRDLWGKEPVPAMRDLYSGTLQTVSGGFLSLGIAGTQRESWRIICR
jgi:hypothetical protein